MADSDNTKKPAGGELDPNTLVRNPNVPEVETKKEKEPAKTKEASGD